MAVAHLDSGTRRRCGCTDSACRSWRSASGDPRTRPRGGGIQSVGSGDSRRRIRFCKRLCGAPRDGRQCDGGTQGAGPGGDATERGFTVSVFGAVNQRSNAAHRRVASGGRRARRDDHRHGGDRHRRLPAGAASARAVGIPPVVPRGDLPPGLGMWVSTRAELGGSTVSLPRLGPPPCRSDRPPPRHNGRRSAAPARRDFARSRARAGVAKVRSSSGTQTAVCTWNPSAATRASRRHGPRRRRAAHEQPEHGAAERGGINYRTLGRPAHAVRRLVGENQRSFPTRPRTHVMASCSPSARTLPPSGMGSSPR